jgi:hypothetical protein
MAVVVRTLAPGRMGVSQPSQANGPIRHNPDALIGLEFPTELVEFLRQNFIEKNYRRVIDTDECDSRIKTELETFVIRIPHRSASFSVTASRR